MPVASTRRRPGVSLQLPRIPKQVPTRVRDPRVMTIRFAKLQDVDEIKTLVEKMIEESTHLVPKLDRSTAIERATRKREIIVATKDGRTVGFIHGVLHEDIIDGAPNFFISSFFVLDNYRNMGIGSSMLSSAIDHAIRNGATEIEVSTMSKDARRLFERFGFTQHNGEVFLELDSSSRTRNKSANLRTSRKVSRLLCATLVLLLLTPLTTTVSAWSNGGLQESEPANPAYGTHDWIAQHALDYLPGDDAWFIRANLNLYLYATELPDRCTGADGICDQVNHHVYYRADRTLQDDAGASLSQDYYSDVAVALVLRDSQRAARSAGIMSHYLSDMAVFGHVMGATTDWGPETHHDEHEQYVNARTNSYTDDFISLAFDGRLDSRSAYNATLSLAYDTTFDSSGQGKTATWMDATANYDWNKPDFRNRAGESINLAVNLLADVLHTLSLQGPSGTAPQPASASLLPYFVLLAGVILIIAVLVYRIRKRKA